MRLSAKPVLALAAALAAVGALYQSEIPFYLGFLPYYLAGPPPAADCGQGPGFAYCAYRAPAGVKDDPRSVLYFLHYAGGSERSWGDAPFSRVYYAEFKRRGLPAPRVVSISRGRRWSVLDRTSSGGRVERLIIERCLPWLEARLGAPRRRYLWGMSQGGYNAAVLLFKRPGLWSGALFSCPAIYPVSMLGKPEEARSYVQRTHADGAKVESMIASARGDLGPSGVPAQDDPLALAGSSARLPPLYVDCTKEDEYGFFEGASRLAALLSARGQPVTFHAETGSHCQVDARAAAAFLADLAARS